VRRDQADAVISDVQEFALERFFAKHEFTVRHVLGASDVEGMPMSEVLALADAESRTLWNELKLNYTESTGHPLLRAEIAAMYDGLGPDDVLTFAGAEEAIFILMNAALRSGDHVVTVWPAYQSLHEVARSVGAEVTPIPLRATDWSLDVDQLIGAIRPRTRMVIINFPHNPTGAHISRAAFDRIVEACRSRGILLFSDEVYRFLEHDAAALLPTAASLYEGAVSLGVMSKTFALPGLRIGWIATRDREVLRQSIKLKDYTTICSSAPSEMLALMALRAKDRVVARSRAIIERNLPVLREFMKRHEEHLSWGAPRAGSTCFPRFRGDVDAEIAAELFIDRAGVAVVPGGRFQFDRAHFRVGFGREDMAEALSRIDPLIADAARG
jgi:aspartate/methionine/tyrosine aminotransferase